MTHNGSANSRRLTTSASFVALVAVGLLSATSIGQTHAPQPTSPARQGIVSSLLILGFTPEALALGGASGAQLSALRAAAADLSAEFEAFRAADEDFRRLRGDHEALRSSARSSGFSPARRASADQAKLDLEQARLARRDSLNTLRGALFDVLANQLSASDLALLRRSLANAQREAPREYRVLNLDDQQWASLERAIERSHTAAKDLSTDESFELSRAESSADVAAARARLRDLLPQLETAYSEALRAELAAE